MIAVSDTGTGIPEEIREKVFEPFFSTKEAGKGTGLGLSMVYGFAKQSGGHVKLYSEVGRGTTVKLFLPRAERHVDALSEVAQSSLAEGGAETILVVEDDPLVRKSVDDTTGGPRLHRHLHRQCQRGARRHQARRGIRSPIHGCADAGGHERPATCRRSGQAASIPQGALHLRLYRECLHPPWQSQSGVLLLSKPYAHTDLARMVRKALSSKPYVQAEMRELREG